MNTSPQPGDRIRDRYEILERLGHGNGGTDTFLGRLDRDWATLAGGWDQRFFSSNPIL